MSRRSSPQLELKLMMTASTPSSLSSRARISIRLAVLLSLFTFQDTEFTIRSADCRGLGQTCFSAPINKLFHFVSYLYPFFYSQTGSFRWCSRFCRRSRSRWCRRCHRRREGRREKGRGEGIYTLQFGIFMNTDNLLTFTGGVRRRHGLRSLRLIALPFYPCPLRYNQITTTILLLL
jgi:hypothetical protein